MDLLPVPNDPLALGIRDAPGGLNYDVVPGAGSHLYESTPVFPTIAFLGMALVLVFIFNYIYKNKTKPRRKGPRLRKMTRIAIGGKYPSV